jgi:SSS family transporter
MTRSFTLLDALVLALYIGGTTYLGVRLGRGQKNARDYFVAGRRVPWWAILFSVVATETSALTFISIPGVAYGGNLTFLQIATGYLVGRIVIAYVLLPRYFDGELVTAYALLERRFGVQTRRLASIVFMATRLFGTSVRIFATAIPIGLILAPVVSGSALMPVSIVLIVGLTLIYTYYGGMRSVIWTDALQMSVYMLGGIVALVIIGSKIPGGWSELLHTASEQGKLRVIDTYVGFDRANTLLAGLIGGACLSMASHGADQLIVQRLMSASGLRDARRALIGSGVIVIGEFALFLMIGVGLFAYYHGQPFAKPDEIFPRFIVEAMPAGMTGLLIAAILAAAMGTVSSSLNSLAASTTHDIFLPLTGRKADDPRALAAGRAFTLLWAAAIIITALLYRQQGTPVVVVALSIASFTYGGLLGGFLLGLISRRAEQRDAMLGMCVGILAMTIVVFAKQISAAYPSTAASLAPLSRIAWPWYVLIGTSITILVGTVSSWLHRPAAAK